MIRFFKDIPANAVSIEEAKLRPAYNNDVIKFYSNDIGSPDYCDIELITGGLSFGEQIRLYPNPQGYFNFNFKPYVTAIINTRKFEDNLETDIDGDEESFVYDFSEGTVYEFTVSITIAEGETTDSDSYSLEWLLAVQQLDNHPSLLKNRLYILSQFKQDTTNKFYLKYWRGYPFDMSIYSKYDEFVIQNLTTLIDNTFDTKGTVNRLFLSDGRTEVTLEDVLGLSLGYNELKIEDNLGGVTNTIYLTLQVEDVQCGMYFKWINPMGGYSYWLFHHSHTSDMSTKQIGELENDFSNVEDTLSRSIQIGKETTETIRVVTDLLNEEEKNILQTIIESPKIYLFTGQPFSQAAATDWMEVTLKSTNIRTKNAKQDLTNFILDFEKPTRYNMTL